MQSQAVGGGKQARKRAREPVEEQEARFSDGEDVPEVTKGVAGLHDPSSSLASLNEGYDFSGRVSADISQPACALCGRDFVVAWDDERHEIVAVDAVSLEHVIYHEVCILRRRAVMR
jgi:hypothetical protein